jgi:hypothetical protein
MKYLPGNMPLDIYAGDGGSLLIRVWTDTEQTQPFDMTGWEFLAQVRQKDTDEDPLTTLSVIPGIEVNEVILYWNTTQSATLVSNPDGTRVGRRRCVGDIQGNPPGGNPMTLVRLDPLYCWNEVSR